MLEFIQIAIGGLVVGSIYAAIALGFSLVYRVTGAINLSQGGFALVSAMIGYTFAVAWGWPLIVAIPAAVATTVVAGVALARFIFVPALSRLSGRPGLRCGPCRPSGLPSAVRSDAGRNRHLPSPRRSPPAETSVTVELLSEQVPYKSAA